MSPRIGALAILCAATAAAADPTYSKDVAPILNANCVSCHRPGEIAPMSLQTFEQVRPWARSIREKVSLGLMPPWHADAPHGTFRNDRRLSDSDKQTLLAWVDAGAPQGDPKLLPPAPRFAEGWEIGQPDLVLPMPAPYEVPASGAIEYQNFVVSGGFPEDKWVQAIEVRPGNRRVVHHILVFANSGVAPEPQPLTQLVPAPRVQGGPLRPVGPGTLIATTAPGTNAMIYQPGTALRIQAGSRLTFQVHYTAAGSPQSDTSSVGFIFAKEPPKTEIRTTAFMNTTLRLPAGSSSTAVDSAIRFEQDSTLWGLFPHTHLRGKSWTYRLVFPDGRTESVLSVPTYNFDWQTYYMFAKPLSIPAGTRLEATAVYDNSANNKFNPDSSIDVRWGEQTWEEMQYSGVTYSVN